MLTNVKTISMPWDEYQKELKSAQQTGETRGFKKCVDLLNSIHRDPRFANRIRANTSYPMSDELNALIEIVKRHGTFSNIKVTANREDL